MFHPTSATRHQLRTCISIYTYSAVHEIYSATIHTHTIMVCVFVYERKQMLWSPDNNKETLVIPMLTLLTAYLDTVLITISCNLNVLFNIYNVIHSLLEN